MSVGYDILSNMRNKKQAEANELYDEWKAVIENPGKTNIDIYQVGMKWASVAAESKALTEAIAELLKAGVI